MHRPLCASLSILIESWAGEIDLNRHRGDGVVSAEELAVDEWRCERIHDELERGSGGCRRGQDCKEEVQAQLADDVNSPASQARLLQQLAATVQELSASIKEVKVQLVEPHGSTMATAGEAKAAEGTEPPKKKAERTESKKKRRGTASPVISTPKLVRALRDHVPALNTSTFDLKASKQVKRHLCGGVGGGVTLLKRSSRFRFSIRRFSIASHDSRIHQPLGWSSAMNVSAVVADWLADLQLLHDDEREGPAGHSPLVTLSPAVRRPT